MGKKKKIVIGTVCASLLVFSFGRAVGSDATATASAAAPATPTASTSSPSTVTQFVPPVRITEVAAPVTKTVTKTVTVKVKGCDTGAAWKAYALKITEAGSVHNKSFQDYLNGDQAASLEEVAHARILTDDSLPLLNAAIEADRKCGR